MSDSNGYDAKNLDALRRDLKDLRANAVATGVVKSTGKGARQGGLAARRAPVAEEGVGAEKGKQMATSMLGLLRSGEESGSPKVPGTNFTELGVKMLLNQLTSPKRQPGPAAAKVIERLSGFLRTPGPDGEQVVAGVSVQKVRVLARMLEQVEKHGWEQVRLIQAKRAEKQTPKPKPKPAPTEPAKGKWSKRRTVS